MVVIQEILVFVPNTRRGRITSKGSVKKDRGVTARKASTENWKEIQHQCTSRETRISRTLIRITSNMLSPIMFVSKASAALVCCGLHSPSSRLLLAWAKQTQITRFWYPLRSLRLDLILNSNWPNETYHILLHHLVPLCQALPLLALADLESTLSYGALAKALLAKSSVRCARSSRWNVTLWLKRISDCVITCPVAIHTLSGQHVALKFIQKGRINRMKVFRISSNCSLRLICVADYEGPNSDSPGDRISQTTQASPHHQTVHEFHFVMSCHF